MQVHTYTARETERQRKRGREIWMEGREGEKGRDSQRDRENR